MIEKLYLMISFVFEQTIQIEAFEVEFLLCMKVLKKVIKMSILLKFEVEDLQP